METRVAIVLKNLASLDVARDPEPVEGLPVLKMEAPFIAKREGI